MQTTCPECRTTYRIAQAQLSLRRGLVRCGHCNAVFNAYDSLLPDLGAETDAPAPRFDPLHALPNSHPNSHPNFRTPPRPSSRLAEQEPAALTEIVLPRPPEPAAEEPEITEPEAPASDPAPGLEAAPEPEPLVEFEPEDIPEPSPPPPFVAPTAATLPSLLQAAEETADDILLSELPTPRETPASPARQRWLTILQGLLALLLAVALALQLTWFLRAEIAQTWPALRPLLTRACEQIGCRVPLPRQLGQEAIVSSALEHDPENRSRVRLSLLLANRRDQAQAWPHIVLTLSDVRENPVAVTQFPPSAYLPKGSRADQGMAAQSELEVRLDLEIGNLDAAGYALELRHP